MIHESIPLRMREVLRKFFGQWSHVMSSFAPMKIVAQKYQIGDLSNSDDGHFSQALRTTSEYIWRVFQQKMCYIPNENISKYLFCKHNFIIIFTGKYMLWCFWLNGNNHYSMFKYYSLQICNFYWYTFKLMMFNFYLWQCVISHEQFILR